MAGDWIKMRSNLWDDPRVSSLCDQTGATESAIIGGLYWLWATADQHTEDGMLPGLTLRSIDRKTAIQGFGQALVSIGWISEEEGAILIHRFDEHNGTSAKRRCTEAQRKANSRKLSADDADTTQTEIAQNRTECVAREREREREDISTPNGVDKRKRATRFPADQWDEVPEDWKQFCQQERPDLNPETVFEKFKDYWTSKPGKAGTKLDWTATWRNWVREERQVKAANGIGNANRNGAAMASYGTIFNTAPEGNGYGRTIDAAPRLG